jgi:uncharacterized protein (TIGR02001 family)
MQKALTSLALCAAAAGPAHALELTANGGFMTEYIFRGIPQDDSSAMGGLDVKHAGFYAGTWAADVGQGLEVDLYGGYNGAIGDISFGLGVTGYYYTDDFDDTYQEINASVGYRIFSISAAYGEYDNFEGTIEGGEGAAPNEKLDYTFVAPRVDYKGFYGLVGIFGDDFDGEYYEAGYGGNFEPIGLDYKLSVIHSTDDLLGDTDGDGDGDDDNSVVLTVSKTFELLPGE